MMSIPTGKSHNELTYLSFLLEYSDCRGPSSGRMPEATVLFGEVVGPCSLWLVPDRGATRDLKCVRKVVKLEEKLAELCCEQEKDLMAGKVVAVMHESLMVRARVENIDANDSVSTVNNIFDSLWEKVVVKLNDKSINDSTNAW